MLSTAKKLGYKQIQFTHKIYEEKVCAFPHVFACKVNGKMKNKI